MKDIVCGKWHLDLPQYLNIVFLSRTLRSKGLRAPNLICQICFCSSCVYNPTSDAESGLYGNHSIFVVCVILFRVASFRWEGKIATSSCLLFLRKKLTHLLTRNQVPLWKLPVFHFRELSYKQPVFLPCDDFTTSGKVLAILQFEETCGGL